MKKCGPNLEKYAKKHGIMDKIKSAMASEESEEEEEAEKGFMKEGHKGERMPKSVRKSNKVV